MGLTSKSAFVLAGMGATMLTCVLAFSRPRQGGKGHQIECVIPIQNSLAALLSESQKPSQYGTEVARMNILCAEALQGSASISIESCLVQLDAWAERVRTETERHRHRFLKNPGEFENSEGFFKMLMLTVVLAEDFGVHYHPQRRLDPAVAVSSDGFFADSRDVFLHGLLGPERRGTCSSLPVLYVAVGRRLGYPLKLVTTKGHLFVRWEGQGERFNIEAAGNGLSRPTDDEYRKWPYPVSDEEIQTEGYLKSLSLPEELAVFLSIRGFCLRDNDRYREAAEAFAAAARFDPSRRQYNKLTEQFTAKAGTDSENKPLTAQTP